MFLIDRLDDVMVSESMVDTVMKRKQRLEKFIIAIPKVVFTGIFKANAAKYDEVALLDPSWVLFLVMYLKDKIMRQCMKISRIN